jgi:hypothetical protein
MPEHTAAEDLDEAHRLAEGAPESADPALRLKEAEVYAEMAEAEATLEAKDG